MKPILTTCAMALTISLVAAPAFAEDPALELVGLWGCELLTPEIRGPLTIERDGERWLASIAGSSAEAAWADGRITFDLPGDRGAFVGRMDGDAIRGHWIQAPGVVLNGRYAAPVVLRPLGDNAWRGEVVPLEDTLTLYLMVQARPDGTAGAFLRNPERNLGRFIRLGQVVREMDQVKFLSEDGSRDRLRGVYREDEQMISIESSSLGLSLDFERQDQDEARGFYPRAAKETRYAYRRPLETNDGWPTAHASEVGLEPEPLRELVQQILDTNTENVSTPYIHGVVVARRGRIVLEEYFYGHHRDLPHDTRSAGKTITSVLTGVAIDQGALDVSTSVVSMFPEYDALDHPDPRKEAITVQHLLTMSTGLASNDNFSDSPGTEDAMQNQSDQPDWYRFMLDLPMAAEPGEKSHYSSGSINLLGGVLAQATGTSVLDFFDEHYARPLNISRYHINLTPTETMYLGGGIRLTPRDQLKLAQLYLDGGVWNGKRVISAVWVETSTRPQASVNAENDYGYGWWIRTYPHFGGEVTACYAGGNGGQYTIMIPDLELVIQFNGGNYGDGRIAGRSRDELVPMYILPAVVD